MSKLRLYARNLTANWIGYVANLVVMFFLTPFVEKCLQEELYGAWSILVTVTGYLGLVELGTRASLGRHVNFYLGRGDINKVNQVFNTALAFFALCGIPLLLIGSGVSVYFGVLFPKVPAEMLGDIRWALMLSIASLWLSLFSASFKQIILARERFDIAAWIDLAVLALRGFGTWYVLDAGGGIIHLAVLNLALSLLGTLADVVVARRVQTDLRLDLATANREEFRELFSFGIWAFISGIAMQILYLTDTVVIGAIFDLQAVTTYSIPLMLITYSRGIITQISKTLTPRTIQSSGRRDLADLRLLSQWGMRASMLIAIPLYLGLVFLGTEFLGLWMRPEFDHQLAGQVLVLLAVPQLVSRSVELTGSVLNGLGYVRFGALMTALQAAVNLALSLWLTLGLGMDIRGIAWGTLVPMVVFNVLIVVFMLRWIEFRFADFAKTVLVRGLLACVLVGAFLWGASQMPAASRLVVFMLKAAGLGAVGLVLAFLVLFTRGERAELLGRLFGALRRGKRPPDGEGQPG